jgi:antagonist of KipI
VIQVVTAGPLTSVQQVGGRVGWRHLGVPVGGAADPWSARLANRLAGNDERAAVLEATLSGPTLRCDRPAAVAVCGGLRPFVGAAEVPRDAAIRLVPGAVLRLDPGDGARGYVAVRGGLLIDPILGSTSTDLRSGFGGLGGRALREGDRLAIGEEAAGQVFRWTGARTRGPIRITAGPHAGAFAQLDGTRWTVGAEADRTGLRLDGSLERLGRLEQIPTMGLPLGAVQIPPDGRPIVMLADRPVSGGYPVVAVVALADIGRVAQLRTGDELTFAVVSIDEARDALRRAESELTALELLDDEREDDELGWAGSLG